MGALPALAAAIHSWAAIIRNYLKLQELDRAAGNGKNRPAVDFIGKTRHRVCAAGVACPENRIPDFPMIWRYRAAPFEDQRTAAGLKPPREIILRMERVLPSSVFSFLPLGRSRFPGLP